MSYEIKKVVTYKVGGRSFNTLFEARQYQKSMNIVKANTKVGPLMVRKVGGSAQYQTSFVTCQCVKCGSILEMKHADVFLYKNRKICDRCPRNKTVRGYLFLERYSPNKLDFTGQLMSALKSCER